MEDRLVRAAAFKWLEEQVRVHGEALPRQLLVRGFEIEGQTVPLMSRQGIFKPRVLDRIPISITTTPTGPYKDRMSPEGLMIYSYRGTDPRHPENAGLREAMMLQRPLIYFHGIMPGKYVAIWPVFIVGDNPAALEFTVAVDDPRHAFVREGGGTAAGARETADEVRRAYFTAVVRQRLHQRAFREIVLDAYREQCAMCRLRHAELLDAAHIIPDGEPGGDPIVSNGIALCKLHHAAFDEFFVGVRPDLVIEIRRDILGEDDGPVLIHGLQGFHGSRLWIPRAAALRPSAARLETRYEKFLAAQRAVD